MTGLLASVATLAELEVAKNAGADIIDLKDPTSGALGAWPVDLIEAAVAAAPGALLSATIGDAPASPLVLPKVQLVARTGVGIVKIGLFPSPHMAAMIAACRPLARRQRLVGVMLADRDPDFELIEALAEARFAGAMVDTADKADGSLRRHLSDDRLGQFVKRARAAGLMVGLAGSLSLADIQPLAALRPDYLGFRGALCAGGDRKAALDPDRIRQVRAALYASAAAPA